MVPIVAPETGACIGLRFSRTPCALFPCNTMKKNDNTPQFNGAFTPEFQCLFKEKRLQLGFSTLKLGRLLGVSSSVISRWENGRTLHSSKEYTPLIADFLAGKFDKKLRQMHEKLLSPSRKPSYPSEAQKLAQKIVSTYQLLSDNQALKEQFLKKLDEVIQKHK